jgi:hypothetical protein
MLSIKLFRLVFCLFQFYRNIETHFFGIEFETTKTNQNNLKEHKFYEKIPIYALYQTVSVGLLFVSVQSKHRNSLFRYRTETTETYTWFRIVPKLVSVVSNRN